MSTFILQSLFLIAVAYLFGALIGCLIRKMFTQSASMLHRAGDEIALEPAMVTGAAAAAVGATAVAGATRYAGEEGEASIEIKRPETRSPAADLSEVNPAAVEFSETGSDIRADIREEPPVIVAPIETPRVRETITFVEPEVDLEPEVSIEPEITLEKVVAPVASVSEVETSSEIMPVPKPENDDLTRIKGVGLPVALELKKIGITRFEQVAMWSDDDIADISEKLGFVGRIERENWMAQAQILATGDELEFTTHQLAEAEQDTASRDIGKLISDANNAGKRAQAGVEEMDDLKRIVGIGTNIETRLRDIGVTRLSQIAAWNQDEVSAVGRRLEIEGRIERENWVQQAKNLESLDA